MFFEKKLSDIEFIDKCSLEQRITVVWNESSEKRNYIESFFDRLHHKCECRDIKLFYNPDNDRLQVDKEEKCPASAIKSLLDNMETEILLLNISTMNMRLLGAVLKYLKYSDYKKVYCVYTEPKRYARIHEHRGEFDLYRRMKSFAPIQGYISTNIDNKPEKWIPFLGFEGNRALQVREEYDFNDYIPVITLPSYKPIWQNFIIRENLTLLDGVKGNTIRYIEADSFLAAYEELERLADIYKDNQLRVTSFGTKINALGILLYLLNHEGVIDLIYDNPIEDGAVYSEEIGRTHVFDISELILSAKGKENDDNSNNDGSRNTD